VLLLGFVSFPLFTRIFSVSEYGVVNLILKVLVSVTVLSKLGVQNSVLRFYEEHAVDPDRSALRRFYSTIFFGTLVLATAITAIFVLSVWHLPESLVTRPIKSLLILGSSLILVRAMWSILAGFLRVEGRTKAYNVWEVLIKAATIAVICLFLFAWERSVRAFFAGTILVEAAIAVAVSLYLFRRHLLHLRGIAPDFYWTVLVFGFPLVIYELASVILDSADRVLIQHYLGAQALGYYSAAHNISTYVQESLMNPVNLALVPLYMKLWVTEGRQETQTFISRALDIYLLVAVGMFTTSRDAVGILASRKFQEAYHLIPLLVVGLVVYSVHIFLTAGLIIHKKTHVMAKLVVYACLLNIGLNIMLLPRIGLQAAALATLLSYSFLIVLMARRSFSHLPIRIDHVALVRYLSAAAFAGLVAMQVELGRPILNVLARGGVGLALYGGILWLMDRRLREVTAGVICGMRGLPASASSVRVPEITPSPRN